MQIKTFLQIEPQYRDYIWGGERLRPGHTPTAEAWVIYSEDRVLGGDYAGRTLAQLANSHAAALLGTRNLETTGLRFPLLIKLLDCAAWLSLQVHPNDAWARHLEGPEYFGKTEAWYFIDATPDAAILCGLKEDVTRATLEAAIRNGAMLDVMQRFTVQAGNSIFIRPGMIHALGPGLLLYEVQQTSDLTYRVWDWDRPATTARPLHIEKSLAVTDLEARGQLQPAPRLQPGAAETLIQCDYFTLELLQSEEKPAARDTGGETFHALTVVEGSARVSGGGQSLALRRLETVLIPADFGAYTIESSENSKVLIASK